MSPVVKPHGGIRMSQLITTFGPGSMVDLPDYSVLISGLDFWTAGGDIISEPRLQEKLAKVLNVPAVELKTPPAVDNDPAAPPRNIVGFQFPEWFITQDLEEQAQWGARTRLLVHRKALTRGKYVDRDRNKRPVVPVRFVRACRAGHIAEIDWYGFIHNEQSQCRAQQRQLFIDERGTSGDLSENWVRCECGKQRSMQEATILAARPLGSCDGSRPWLGPMTKEACGEPSRLLIRSASNAYFPQLMSVISLPARNEAVRQAVDGVWSHLEIVESMNDLRYERKKAAVKAALEGLSDEEVFAELQARRMGGTAKEKSVKVAELETLIAAKDELGEDRAEGVFFARALSRDIWNKPWMQPVQRVVLIHRLREVAAQVGFTRFEAAAPDTEGELDIGVRRAPLAREITWLPAYENKGEGVFLQFRKEAIRDWLTRPAVQERAQAMALGFKAWSSEHSGSNRRFPDLPYLMLHSFSHLLVTALSLGCGYPSSSIRERVYAIPDVGYGILLYTGTSDAEGTLGGLVQVGRRIHETVRNALDLGLLCSNDPVCAQHEPNNPHEHRYLHGAACHGCLLIAETSCEQQNDFLDRSLVVPTVESRGCEFFKEILKIEPATSLAGAV